MAFEGVSVCAVCKQLVSEMQVKQAAYNRVLSAPRRTGLWELITCPLQETLAFYFQSISKNGKCKVRKQVYPLQEGRQRETSQISAWCDFIFIFCFCIRTHPGACAGLGHLGISNFSGSQLETDLPGGMGHVNSVELGADGAVA